MVSCPECEAAVAVPGSLLLSEIVECGECRSELEVLALNPVVLALAPEVEEDWGE
jgi:alpha-aminoadipate carrier protein LysW